jgi:hypothetical protein
MDSRQCPHCHSRAKSAHCTTCMRVMCEDCISFGDAGPVCGLCKDREDGYHRWQAVGQPGEFDEWYDINA